MKTVKWYSLVLLLIGAGCSSDYFSSTPRTFQSREEFLDHLMKGYIKGTENLYNTSSKGRMERLHQALGLDTCDNIYPVNKGQMLIFQKYSSDPNELKVLVLSADAPPRLIKSPEELWDGKCRVFRYSQNKEPACDGKRKYSRKDYPSIDCHISQNDYLKFFNGYVISGGDIAAKMDEDERFICYEEVRKRNTSDKDSIRRPDTYFIISVDDPKIAVQGCLSYFPRTMAIKNDRLYLAGITRNKKLPVFQVEVYDVADNQLNYVKDFYVDTPFGFVTPDANIWDYDYRTNSQIFEVYRDFPFRHDRYLYDYDDNTLKTLPYFGKLRFINPEILQNAIRYVDIEKL